jgi:hypothetical protein
VYEVADSRTDQQLETSLQTSERPDVAGAGQTSMILHRVRVDLPIIANGNVQTLAAGADNLMLSQSLVT